MPSLTLGAALGVAFFVVLHTAIAAVAARFFRLRLSTRWGRVAFTVFFVPVVYLATTLVLGALGVGAGAFESRRVFLTVTWAFPFFLGYSVDLFWMPPPEPEDEG